MGLAYATWMMKPSMIVSKPKPRASWFISTACNKTQPIKRIISRHMIDSSQTKFGTVAHDARRNNDYRQGSCLPPRAKNVFRDVSTKRGVVHQLITPVVKKFDVLLLRAQRIKVVNFINSSLNRSLSSGLLLTYGDTHIDKKLYKYPLYGFLVFLRYSYPPIAALLRPGKLSFLP